MLIAFLTVATIGLSNASLGYLNYPTQVVEVSVCSIVLCCVVCGVCMEFCVCVVCMEFCVCVCGVYGILCGGMYGILCLCGVYASCLCGVVCVCAWNFVHGWCWCGAVWVNYLGVYIFISSI